MTSTPLRYPGGKGRLTDFLRLIFEQNDLLDGHYIEPYAGGAGVAINLLLLQYASCIHLNDLNPSVFSFWHSVVNAPDELCKMIVDTPVDMDTWRRQQQIQKQAKNHSMLELGFSTFFLNRTNRSGILTGGVIGGNNQEGAWKIDARYNKSQLCKRIEKIALYRSRIRLYNLDAASLITDVFPTLSKKSLVYLDPPYYVKASRLYQNHYDHNDHVAISKLVRKKIRIPWVVSYDTAPEIMEMYQGFQTISYEMNHTAAKNHKGGEVMFFSNDLIVPGVRNPSQIMAA